MPTPKECAEDIIDKYPNIKVYRFRSGNGTVTNGLRDDPTVYTYLYLSSRQSKIKRVMIDFRGFTKDSPEDSAERTLSFEPLTGYSIVRSR